MADRLSYSGITIKHRRQGEPSEVTINLFTRGGSLREAPLTENQLYALAQDALRHAAVLRKQSEET